MLSTMNKFVYELQWRHKIHRLLYDYATHIILSLPIIWHYVANLTLYSEWKLLPVTGWLSGQYDIDRN